MENQNSREVAIDAIRVSQTNEMFRSPKALANEALQDLADSIRQFGVIQPILIRPNPDEAGKFVLICGERRMRASMLAGKSTVPAVIKDVPDDEALVLQITENMQREDVHPLHEAKGYKVIMENNNRLTTSELALKFGKSETYVLQRLKLNDLVREAKQAFLKNDLLLGHALILARLTPSDQREAMEDLTSYRGGYGTVQDLQEFIDHQITNSLSKAPFDLTDELLVKKAGACITCPKRSGASPLLFAEIKEKDRCFDKACFTSKCEKFLINRTKQIIETEPHLTFLMSSYEQPPEKITELLAEHKLKAMVEYNDFLDHKQGGAKVKGLWITGRKAGQIATVYLKKATADVDKDDVRTVTAKIQQRMVRGRELDGEKVYAKILESLRAHKTQKKSLTLKIQPAEEVLLWYIVFDKAGFNLKRQLSASLGLPKDNPEKLVENLEKLRPEQKAFMLRRVMMEVYGGNYPDSAYGRIIRKIAEGYADIDIRKFEKEQQEICDKRETRAKERIKLLKKNAKNVNS